jgi:ATP-dependent Clp endopeptidase proteolytic subunit ClpP
MSQTKSPSIWLAPVAAVSGEYDLMVHGDIGESWFGESVSAKNVSAQLRKLPASTKTVNIRVNSFGGSVADGLAIYNALRDVKARKVTIIDGVAISAGSLIAMAGDEIRAPKTSLMMIHGPWTVAQGNAADMRQHAEVLDKWADAMVSTYVRKTGKTDEEIRSMLKDGEDHWFTAEEALDAGFIDALIEEDAMPEKAKALLDRAPVALRAVAMAALHRAMPFPQTKEDPMSANTTETTETAVETVAETVAETVETPVVAEAAPEAKVDAPVEAVVAPEAKFDIAALRAQMEAEFNAKVVAIEAEKAEIQARLSQEVEAKEVRAIVGEVASVYGSLPGKSEDLGPAIRALRKSSPEAAAVVEATLKAANGLLTQLMEPKGTTKAEGLSIEQEVDRLARAHMTVNASLTIEQARSKVYTENPKMLAAIRGEDEV